MSQTYAEASAANWPRYSCHVCLAPCAWDRDGRCESCLKEMIEGMKEGIYERVTTKPKELLPCKPK